MFLFFVNLSYRSSVCSIDSYMDIRHVTDSASASLGLEGGVLRRTEKERSCYPRLDRRVVTCCGHRVECPRDIRAIVSNYMSQSQAEE